jgi:hypothetical protein
MTSLGLFLLPDFLHLRRQLDLVEHPARELVSGEIAGEGAGGIDRGCCGRL